MSEVKRLEMDHKGLPFVDENGVYVLYEDYAALQEKIDFKQNLTEQVVALQKERDALAAKGMELCREAAHVYQKYNVTQMPDMDLVDCQTIQEFSDLAGGSTTTDAYLNSVRAEGVDYVAEAIGAKCAELKIGSKDWKALKSIVFTLGDFSEKLRAGEPS